MSHQRSRSAARVQEALAAAGVAARVVELPASARSSQEAARAIGCAVEQIAKSIVFRRVDTGRPVIVVLRGIDRVDTAALGRALGAGVKRAEPVFVREATGFVIGGVPPLGHAALVETLMDSALLAYDTVWAAAGTPQSVFAVSPSALATAASMNVVAVAERSGPATGTTR